MCFYLPVNRPIQLIAFTIMLVAISGAKGQELKDHCQNQNEGLVIRVANLEKIEKIRQIIDASKLLNELDGIPVDSPDALPKTKTERSFEKRTNGETDARLLHTGISVMARDIHSKPRLSNGQTSRLVNRVGSA